MRLSGSKGLKYLIIIKILLDLLSFVRDANQVVALVVPTESEKFLFNNLRFLRTPTACEYPPTFTSARIEIFIRFRTEFHSGDSSFGVKSIRSPGEPLKTYLVISSIQSWGIKGKFVFFSEICILFLYLAKL